MRPNDALIESLFTIATELNTKELGIRTRMVAAVLRRGKVISIGHNSKKSHPMQSKFSKNQHAIYLHAEIDAIKNAIRSVGVDNISGVDIVIVRAKTDNINKVFTHGNSKPCSGCMRAIAHFDLNEIWFHENGSFEVISNK